MSCATGVVHASEDQDKIDGVPVGAITIGIGGENGQNGSGNGNGPARCTCGAFVSETAGGYCKRCEQLRASISTQFATTTDTYNELLAEMIASDSPDLIQWVQQAGYPMHDVALLYKERHDRDIAGFSLEPEHADRFVADEQAFYSARDMFVGLVGRDALDANNELTADFEVLRGTPAYETFAQARDVYMNHFDPADVTDLDVAYDGMKAGKYSLPTPVRTVLREKVASDDLRRQLTRKIGSVGKELAQQRQNAIEARVAAILKEEGIDNLLNTEHLIEIVTGRPPKSRNTPTAKRVVTPKTKRRAMSNETRQKMRELALNRTRCQRCKAFARKDGGCTRCENTLKAIMEAGIEEARAKMVRDRVMSEIKTIEQTFNDELRSRTISTVRTHLLSQGEAGKVNEIVTALSDALEDKSSPLPNNPAVTPEEAIQTGIEQAKEFPVSDVADVVAESSGDASTGNESEPTATDVVIRVLEVVAHPAFHQDVIGSPVTVRLTSTGDDDPSQARAQFDAAVNYFGGSRRANVDVDTVKGNARQLLPAGVFDQKLESSELDGLLAESEAMLTSMIGPNREKELPTNVVKLQTAIDELSTALASGDARAIFYAGSKLMFLRSSFESRTQMGQDFRWGQHDPSATWQDVSSSPVHCPACGCFRAPESDCANPKCGMTRHDADAEGMRDLITVSIPQYTSPNKIEDVPIIIPKARFERFYKDTPPPTPEAPHTPTTTNTADGEDWAIGDCFQCGTTAYQIVTVGEQVRVRNLATNKLHTMEANDFGRLVGMMRVNPESIEIHPISTGQESDLGRCANCGKWANKQLGCQHCGASTDVAVSDAVAWYTRDDGLFVFATAAVASQNPTWSRSKKWSNGKNLFGAGSDQLAPDWYQIPGEHIGPWGYRTYREGKDEDSAWTWLDVDENTPQAVRESLIRKGWSYGIKRGQYYKKYPVGHREVEAEFVSSLPEQDLSAFVVGEGEPPEVKTATAPASPQPAPENEVNPDEPIAPGKAYQDRDGKWHTLHSVVCDGKRTQPRIQGEHGLIEAPLPASGNNFSRTGSLANGEWLSPGDSVRVPGHSTPLTVLDMTIGDNGHIGHITLDTGKSIGGIMKQVVTLYANGRGEDILANIKRWEEPAQTDIQFETDTYQMPSAGSKRCPTCGRFVSNSHAGDTCPNCATAVAQFPADSPYMQSMTGNDGAGMLRDLLQRRPNLSPAQIMGNYHSVGANSTLFGRGIVPRDGGDPVVWYKVDAYGVSFQDASDFEPVPKGATPLSEFGKVRSLPPRRRVAHEQMESQFGAKPSPYILMERELLGGKSAIEAVALGDLVSLRDKDGNVTRTKLAEIGVSDRGVLPVFIDIDTEKRVSVPPVNDQGGNRQVGAYTHVIAEGSPIETDDPTLSFDQSISEKVMAYFGLNPTEMLPDHVRITTKIMGETQGASRAQQRKVFVAQLVSMGMTTKKAEAVTQELDSVVGDSAVPELRGQKAFKDCMRTIHNDGVYAHVPADTVDGAVGAYLMGRLMHAKKEAADFDPSVALWTIAAKSGPKRCQTCQSFVSNDHGEPTCKRCAHLVNQAVASGLDEQAARVLVRETGEGFRYGGLPDLAEMTDEIARKIGEEVADGAEPSPATQQIAEALLAAASEDTAATGTDDAPADETSRAQPAFKTQASVLPPAHLRSGESAEIFPRDTSLVSGARAISWDDQVGGWVRLEGLRPKQRKGNPADYLEETGDPESGTLHLYAHADVYDNGGWQRRNIRTDGMDTQYESSTVYVRDGRTRLFAVGQEYVSADGQIHKVAGLAMGETPRAILMSPNGRLSEVDPQEFLFAEDSPSLIHDPSGQGIGAGQTPLVGRTAYWNHVLFETAQTLNAAYNAPDGGGNLPKGQAFLTKLLEDYDADPALESNRLANLVIKAANEIQKDQNASKLASEYATGALRVIDDWHDAKGSYKKAKLRCRSCQGRFVSWDKPICDPCTNAIAKSSVLDDASSLYDINQRARLKNRPLADVVRDMGGNDDDVDLIVDALHWSTQTAVFDPRRFSPVQEDTPELETPYQYNIPAAPGTRFPWHPAFDLPAEATLADVNIRVNSPDVKDTERLLITQYECNDRGDIQYRVEHRDKTRKKKRVHIHTGDELDEAYPDLAPSIRATMDNKAVELTDGRVAYLLSVRGDSQLQPVYRAVLVNPETGAPEEYTDSLSASDIANYGYETGLPPHELQDLWQATLYNRGNPLDASVNAAEAYDKRIRRDYINVAQNYHVGWDETVYPNGERKRCLSCHGTFVTEAKSICPRCEASGWAIVYLTDMQIDDAQALPMEVQEALVMLHGASRNARAEGVPFGLDMARKTMSEYLRRVQYSEESIPTIVDAWLANGDPRILSQVLHKGSPVPVAEEPTPLPFVSKLSDEGSKQFAPYITSIGGASAIMIPAGQGNPLPWEEGFPYKIDDFVDADSFEGSYGFMVELNTDQKSKEGDNLTLAITGYHGKPNDSQIQLSLFDPAMGKVESRWVSADDLAEVYPEIGSLSRTNGRWTHGTLEGGREVRLLELKNNLFGEPEYVVADVSRDENNPYPPMYTVPANTVTNQQSQPSRTHAFARIFGSGLDRLPDETLADYYERTIAQRPEHILRSYDEAWGTFIYPRVGNKRCDTCHGTFVSLNKPTCPKCEARITYVINNVTVDDEFSSAEYEAVKGVVAELNNRHRAKVAAGDRYNRDDIANDAQILLSEVGIDEATSTRIATSIVKAEDNYPHATHFPALIPLPPEPGKVRPEDAPPPTPTQTEMIQAAIASGLSPEKARAVVVDGELRPAAVAPIEFDSTLATSFADENAPQLERARSDAQEQQYKFAVKRDTRGKLRCQKCAAFVSPQTPDHCERCAKTAKFLEMPRYASKLASDFAETPYDSLVARLQEATSTDDVHDVVNALWLDNDGVKPHLFERAHEIYTDLQSFKESDEDATTTEPIHITGDGGEDPSPLAGISTDDGTRAREGGQTSGDSRASSGDDTSGDGEPDSTGGEPVGGLATSDGELDNSAERGGRTAGATVSEPDDGDGGFRSRGLNFRIKGDEDLGIQKGAGAKTRIDNNIEAIKLLKQLEAEGRPATEEEQKVLAKYTGWGWSAVAGALDNWGRALKDENHKLQTLLSPDELNQARHTSLNAHYTSPEVVRAMWDMVVEMGYTDGPVLEPACGIGNFMGLVPDGTAYDVDAVELDATTAGIAKHLYQGANVIHEGFQTSGVRDNHYNVVIGNFPFGDYDVFDPTLPSDFPSRKLRIHDYFAVNSMRKAAPGGLVGFITSRYAMDKLSPEVRIYLEKHGEFVAATRLPNTAFAQNARTEVTTDIIFFRKRAEGIDPLPKTDWVNTTRVDIPKFVEGDQTEYYGEESPATYDPETNMTTVPGASAVSINNYYLENPDMMVGRMETTGGMYSADSVSCVLSPSKNIKDELERVKARLPKNIAPANLGNRERCVCGAFMAADGVCNNPNCVKRRDVYRAYTGLTRITSGEFVFQDDQLWRVMPDSQKTLRSVTEEDMGGRNKKASLEKLTAMAKIKPSLRELMEESQKIESDEAELAELRAELERVYDEFRAEHGSLRDRANVSALKEDSMYPTMLGMLEDRDGNKSPVFNKRIMWGNVRPTKAETPQDALLISLNEYGGVDMGRIRELVDHLDLTQEQIINQLEGLIFWDPDDGRFVYHEEFLSGNVREKIERFEGRVNFGESEYTNHVQALLGVMPDDLTENEVFVQMGASWVPPEDVKEFIAYTLNLRRWDMDKLAVSYDESNGWKIEQGDLHNKSTAQALSVPGHPRGHAFRIIEDALNGKPTIITVDGQKDPEAILMADQHAQTVRRYFQEWIWVDDNRKERLLKEYNRRFNSHVVRKYDGSHLTFPGLNPAWQLRPAQKDSVHRVVQSPNTLLAHVVGAGKTIEMIASVMELKRVHGVRSPIVVAPNHVIDQHYETATDMYPGAKILLVDKRSASSAEIQETMARIASDDWDMVIMSADAYDRIGMNDETMVNYIEVRMAKLEHDYRQAVANAKDPKKDRGVKALERKKAKLQAKLDKHKYNMTEGNNASQGLTWEDLGAQTLVVDESHRYKNADFDTALTNVKGISGTNSSRADAHELKVRYLQRRCAGGRFVDEKGICTRCVCNSVNRGVDKRRQGFVIEATGTPITNSIAEMYILLRRHAPERLEAAGINTFDQWVSVFATQSSQLEMRPDGSGYEYVSRLTKFNNIPELLNIFRQFSDVKMDPEELGIVRPLMENDTEITKAEFEASKALFLNSVDPDDREAILTHYEKLSTPEFEDRYGSTNEYIQFAEVRGKYRSPIVVGVEASEQQKQMQKNLVERAKEIDPAKRGEKGADNILAVMNDGTKLALEPRLFDPNVEPDSGEPSKIDAMVDAWMEVYNGSDTATQMVFMDAGVPKDGHLNFLEVKRQLKESGLSAHYVGGSELDGLLEAKKPTLTQFRGAMEGVDESFVGKAHYWLSGQENSEGVAELSAGVRPTSGQLFDLVAQTNDSEYTWAQLEEVAKNYVPNSVNSWYRRDVAQTLSGKRRFGKKSSSDAFLVPVPEGLDPADVEDLIRQAVDIGNAEIVHHHDVASKTPNILEVRKKTAPVLYDEIKRKLVERGVPAEEIAYIHDCKKDSDKLHLFQRMNADRPQTRFLLGSSSKMGTGVNAQRNLKMLTHMDTGWRPDEIEQRNGRALRQGNENGEVRIVHAVTEGTMDALKYQIVSPKADMVKAAMSGGQSKRSMDEIDNDGSSSVSVQQIVAVASGNQDAIRLLELEQSITRRRAQKREYERTSARRRATLVQMREQLASLQEQTAISASFIAQIGAEDVRDLTYNVPTVNDNEDDPQYGLLGRHKYEGSPRRIDLTPNQSGFYKDVGRVMFESAKVMRQQAKADGETKRIKGFMRIGNLDCTLRAGTNGLVQISIPYKNPVTGEYAVKSVSYHDLDTYAENPMKMAMALRNSLDESFRFASAAIDTSTDMKAQIKGLEATLAKQRDEFEHEAELTEMEQEYERLHFSVYGQEAKSD